MSIDYTLAKELKDAGLLQSFSGSGGFISGEDGDCYVPSLSELIGACGETFHGVYKSLHPDEDGAAWVANALLGTFEKGTWINGLGQSPKEAVARLYLALKNKHES